MHPHLEMPPKRIPDEAKVRQALQDIAAGKISMNKAAKTFGLSRSMLQRRRDGARPKAEYHTSMAALTMAEEEGLVKAIIWADRSGHGWTAKQEDLRGRRQTSSGSAGTWYVLF